MVVLQYAFLTHIILMDPYDNPKHKKTLIGAVLEHLKFTESRLSGMQVVHMPTGKEGCSAIAHSPRRYT